MRAIAALLAALLAASPAWAVEDYASCAALVSADPATAEVEADRWERFGGGAPAAHCKALALEAQGADLKAAEVLIYAFEIYPELQPRAQAEILAQAARIYVKRGLYEQADYILNRAAEIMPDAPDLLRARATLRLAQGAPSAADEDLTQLLQAHPPTAEDVLLRATARRQAGSMADARSDAVWAAELAPESATVWLELGAAEAALGNKDEARRAWLKAISLDPDGAEGAIGRTAQLSLQKMELGAE